MVEGASLRRPTRRKGRAIAGRAGVFANCNERQTNSALDERPSPFQREGRYGSVSFELRPFVFARPLSHMR